MRILTALLLIFLISLAVRFSKNALRLLETMEFPKEIVERAKGLEESGG